MRPQRPRGIVANFRFLATRTTITAIRSSLIAILT